MLSRVSSLGRMGSHVARTFTPAAASLSTSAVSQKMVAPPMVYISGEEMTKYCMDLIREQWVNPYVDTSKWEYFDLSCHGRDATDDKVLSDAVAAGARICAIFKEPTITPTEIQMKELGLKRPYGSPNGAMRQGWNGITISRDTIHIEGLELGYKRPVLFERHAVGGEYCAKFAMVGPGKVTSEFQPADGGAPVTIDERTLVDNKNAVVVYHNPLDNVSDLGHHFFKRCLEAEVTPYVVTKKTVFKWQEDFWLIMLDVFNTHYKEAYVKAGLMSQGEELQHLISDAATMQIIRWTDGGFGMAAHNYDGDMLTDEVSQVHRSPGFITSNLIGKTADGTKIMEFEASHGTVADMWHDHLNGKETSFNPLGMVEALIGAMQHSARLANPGAGEDDEIIEFTNTMRKEIHTAMAKGKGTRDLCGPVGLTTEAFVAYIGSKLAAKYA